MKVLIITLSALLTFAASRVAVLNEVDDAAKFIECVRQALDGGLKDADLPDHNNIKISSNITIPITFIGANGTFTLFNTFFRDLAQFKIVSVNVLRSSADTRNITFDVIYKQLRVDSGYNASITILGQNQNLSGVLNFSLPNFHFRGNWRFVTLKSGQNNLTNAQLTAQTDFPKVKISGINPILEPILENGFSLLVQVFINDAFNQGGIGEALRPRINDGWTSANKSYRIAAINKHCKRF